MILALYIHNILPTAAGTSRSWTRAPLSSVSGLATHLPSTEKFEALASRRKRYAIASARRRMSRSLKKALAMKNTEEQYM